MYYFYKKIFIPILISPMYFTYLHFCVCFYQPPPEQTFLMASQVDKYLVCVRASSFKSYVYVISNYIKKAKVKKKNTIFFYENYSLLKHKEKTNTFEGEAKIKLYTERK